ncbi:MAG: NAD-dependent succinate-semialdehyde dehydrogenase [Alphaproteobacteria bacterium]|nr:NAD-dependent succinate-semialdehyde dehydrogenase [Alphaproteobacteria bacterium]
MQSLLKAQAFINGAWASASDTKTFDVTNPATGEKITAVSDCTADDAHEAVDAANAAFSAWKSALPQERAKLLRAWQNLIAEHADELAKILTSEQGKPLAEARGEIAGGIAMVAWAAEEARRYYGETIPPFKTGARAITMREPIGVVAAITPWNFPHSMITRKVAPALAAGCTVVLKPAEDTPLSALALAALAEQAGFPKGVFNVIPTSKPKDVGSVLTSSPLVRKLSFTGSTEVGRLLMQQCAPTLKRLSMELGGNAPFIVFDDADIAEAVKGAMASKFRNAGQTCICANRIFVQKGIYDAFAKALQKAIESLKTGNGMEEGVTTGPLINQDGVKKVQDLVADATAKGAKIALGGKKGKQGGTFYEPTLVLDADVSMRIAGEEIFGPVAALFPFADETEVIQMANSSEHGLAAYFYTRDIGRAFRVAEALEYGMVGINEPLLASEAVPFGGIKQSGFGREGGKQGLDDYTALKYALFGGL